jgi:hypothetical protein
VQTLADGAGAIAREARLDHFATRRVSPIKRTPLRPIFEFMRASLRCPGCNTVGVIGERVSMFAWREPTPEGDPTVRCGNCGSGFAMRRSSVLRRMRTRPVDPDVWSRMEAQWERNNPLPATAAPPLPDARELAEGLLAAGLGGPHVVHQLAEATELSEDEARRLMTEISKGPSAAAEGPFEAAS